MLGQRLFKTRCNVGISADQKHTDLTRSLVVLICSFRLPGKTHLITDIAVPRPGSRSRRHLLFEEHHRRERNLGDRSLRRFCDTFLAMMLNMCLCSFAAVMDCMLKVAVSGVSMMGSLLVVAGFVMPGGFPVVKSCFLVVFCCLVVMFGRLF